MIVSTAAPQFSSHSQAIGASAPSEQVLMERMEQLEADLIKVMRIQEKSVMLKDPKTMQLKGHLPQHLAFLKYNPLLKYDNLPDGAGAKHLAAAQ